MALGLAFAAMSPSAYAEDTRGTPAPADTSSRDDADIRALIASQVEAWNAGDAKAFSVRFAPDGTFTNIRGTVFYGHRAFEDRHAEIFASVFKGTKISMAPDRIWFVRPDVAIADISATVSGLGGRTPPGVKRGAGGALRTRLQEVLVKDGGTWWIASYHNVDVKGP